MIPSKAIPGALVIGDGDAAHYLDGTGAYSAPAGTTLHDGLSNFVNAANTVTNPSASTLTANTWNVINATSACNAKLPTPTAGHVIGVRIKTGSTNLFILNPNASENIGPGTNSSRVMWAGESAILVSDGTDWIKVAGVSLPMICLMSTSASQSIVHDGGTWHELTNLAANGVGYDNTGLMTGTNVMNIQRTGNYNAQWHLVWLGTGSTLYGICGVPSGGLPTGPQISDSSSTTPSLQASQPIVLTAGNTYALFATNTSGGDVSVYGGASDTTTRLALTETPAW